MHFDIHNMNIGLCALATRGVALGWNFNLLPSCCENYQQVTGNTYGKKLYAAQICAILFFPSKRIYNLSSVTNCERTYFLFHIVKVIRYQRKILCRCRFIYIHQQILHHDIHSHSSN